MQQSYRMARSTDHVVLIFVTFDDCARQVACQRSSCCSCVVIIFNAHVHRNDIKLGRPSAITCNQHHIKSVRSSKEEAVQNDGLPFLPISAHPPHYVARQLLRATGQFSHQSLSEQRSCDMNRLAAMMVGTSTQWRTGCTIEVEIDSKEECQANNQIADT